MKQQQKVPFLRNQLRVVRAHNDLADLWDPPKPPESPLRKPGCVSKPTCLCERAPESSPSLISHDTEGKIARNFASLPAESQLMQNLSASTSERRPAQV